eukprot:95635-Hanusia_phi.AAC.2
MFTLPLYVFTRVTWKIGASGSLLMATIVLESFMPARCWMAPAMGSNISWRNRRSRPEIPMAK